RTFPASPYTTLFRSSRTDKPAFTVISISTDEYCSFLFTHFDVAHNFIVGRLINDRAHIISMIRRIADCQFFCKLYNSVADGIVYILMNDRTRTSRTFLPRKTKSRLRSEEHTSELQSRFDLVCRLLLEKKKNKNTQHLRPSTSN